MPITMRALDVDDLAECLALSLTEEQYSVSQIPKMAELFDKLLPEEAVECQSRFDIEFKVFTDAANIVGFAAYEHEEGTTTYEILYFLIDQQWQGKGYGKSAFAQLLYDLLSKSDCVNIKIRYMDFNEAARSLYAKFGFREAGESDGYVDAVFTTEQQVEANQPYALASPAERERRTDLSDSPHMKPLMDYLNQVRKKQGDAYDLPAFDPLDGGTQARVLFLLEAPGPKAVGSTFISRNNPDPTARNLCELLAESGIPRKDTLIWNIVPWYVSDGQGRIRTVTRKDITEALPYLGRLLELLPNLQVIALVGKKAQSAATDIRAHAMLPFVTLPHPSARVFNVWPTKKDEARAALKTVTDLLSQKPAGKSVSHINSMKQ